MKKLFALIALALPFAVNAFSVPEARQMLGETKRGLTIINHDTVRHELHAVDANGVTWKFYIKPGEHMSELIPIPTDARRLSVVGSHKSVPLDGGVFMVTIEKGEPMATIRDAR